MRGKPDSTICLGVFLVDRFLVECQCPGILEADFITVAGMMVTWVF